MRLRAAVPQVLLGAVLACAAGCSSGGEPSAAATTPASVSPTGSAPASPTPSPTVALPTGCDSMLPFTDLDQALGRPLFGETSFTLGVAQPSIGRTGRITCRYGLPKGGRGAAPVEVGVSSYVDPQSATERVEATVAQERKQGASYTAATVSGLPAMVISTKTGFIAVLAQGSRTIAVTVLRVLRGNPDRAAVAVAEKVLANLGE